ncbi:putative potassium/sodium hyperpolarization-activated cyclic nucleotide-gated channel 3-like [Triplophysa rosa]|uniref:Potassium/sodium hyperpolarization-activated cyclic nucleotide-gated channel 3-like n=1 Tax=Triplophysa rosa TaxID=992332 RepID=A0A9W7WK49_TRIRA|nr:putative potassium/sodium hyperpolarization-activated cyclic nucleotide-gated channel 3-like [Triplophysa rosa]
MGFIKEEDQVPVLDPQLIRNNFIKSWFVLDLLAAFPADSIIVVVVSHIQLAAVRRILRSVCVVVLLFLITH